MKFLFKLLFGRFIKIVMCHGYVEVIFYHPVYNANIEYLSRQLYEASIVGVFLPSLKKCVCIFVSFAL